MGNWLQGSNPVGATIGSGPRAGRQQPSEGAVAGERVAPRAGDEHGGAVDAINQECLERLPCLRALTAEYTPYTIRASAQLAGHAIAIYRNDRSRQRQRGQLLFEAFSSS